MGFNSLVLITGIGNQDCGDDGAGIAVARLLRTRLPPEIMIIEQSGEATDLIETWQNTGTSAVYVIDAMSSDLPIGTILEFEAHRAPLLAHFAGDYSTHSFGLAQAVELARALDCLPSTLIVYGIEGKCFDPGTPLSPEVEQAVHAAAERIFTGLNNLLPRG